MSEEEIKDDAATPEVAAEVPAAKKARAGKMGFKGSRKSTAYAAQVVSQDACRQAMSHGLKEVEVRVKGPGSGRESAVRAVQGLGINITAIKDVTPIPHNGCRPKKARRV
jgi:small subunit ribosomal protein S11